MLKTLIAIAGICALVACVGLVLFAPGNNMDIKIPLVTAAVGVIGTICGYSYGLETGKTIAEKAKVNKQE